MEKQDICPVQGTEMGGLAISAELLEFGKGQQAQGTTAHGQVPVRCRVWEREKSGLETPFLDVQNNLDASDESPSTC